MLQNYLIIFFGVEKSFIKFYRKKNSVNKRGRKFNFEAKYGWRTVYGIVYQLKYTVDKCIKHP